MDTIDYLNLLPDELLLNILKYLPLKERILYRRVCKRWQQLLLMPDMCKHQHTIGLRLTRQNLEHVDREILNLYRKRLFLDGNEIVRWKCGVHDIHPNNDVIDAHVFQNFTHFLVVLKQWPNLQCIDMRAMDLTDEVVNALIEHAKNLECVHINFLRANDFAVWTKFVANVIPNIKHLSVDSLIKFTIAGYSPYTHLFNFAAQLQSLAIVLYANSEINVQSFQALKPCLRDLSIFSVGFKNIDKVFDNIRQSVALNGILKLRLHSHSVYHLQPVMSEYIGLFRNLQALSMSGFFVNDLAHQYLNSLENLVNLTDLSLFFNRYCSIKLFSQHMFANILILRLGFVEIKDNFDLRQTFPKVELLKLVDARFDSTFSESIINCENLKVLHIQYQSKDWFAFTEERANTLKAIIDRSLLKELVVDNWNDEWKTFLTECEANLRSERGFKLTFI